MTCLNVRLARRIETIVVWIRFCFHTIFWTSSVLALAAPVFDGSLDVPRARPFDVSYDASTSPQTSPHVDGGPYDGSPDGGSYVLILRLSLAMFPFLVFMLQPTVSSDHLDQGATLFDLPSDFPDAYNVSRKF